MRSNIFYVLTVTSALTVFPYMALAGDSPNAASAVQAGGQPQDTSALLNLSLQQLSDTEVTSVSKKAEKASQAPAAIYVITQEDIRRSGLQSVPELLRMVPGLQVAQSGSENWAVTSRGFNGQFANKLLVLIDGRTVYSPIFSGVQWDVQNVMLEDVERIEVIRGPGATLWGANAVNGVINIITKSAKDTQGTLITAAGGNQERAATSGRYGGTVGDLSYRTYAQYFNDNQEHTVANPAFHISEGQGADDQWHNTQGGFRLDWGKEEKNQTTLQGDAYQGQENSMRFLPVTSSVNPNRYNAVVDTDDVSGMNLLGRWTHELGAGSDIALQGYYDDVLRETEYAGITYHLQTFDLDFQHNLTVNDYNDVTWGLGYRSIRTDFGNSFYISFNPEDHNDNLFSGFLQDKIALVQDKLFLTLGSKLEHNDYTEFEYEPSAKLAWLPTSNQTVWASVSRAVHTANQSNQNLDLVLQAGPSHLPAPFQTGIAEELGSPEATSEDLIAYELGYRIQPRENLSVDVTAFLNEYSRLTSNAQASATLQFNPAIGYYVLVPEVVGNNNNGETHGMEIATTWQATKHIKFSGSYTLFNSDLNITGPSLVTAQGNAPHQQFNARAYVDLPYNVQFDTMIYRVNTLPAVGSPTEVIPAYTRLDTRLGWTPVPGLDLSLIGQNLLQSEHQEYSPFIYQTPEEIGRSVLAKATLRF